MLYSRAASFAARTGQALLGRPERQHQVPHLGRARLQLYVDDPAVAVAGKPSEIEASIDILLVWWLCLGLPLAWQKGLMTPATTPYTWIGVVYNTLPRGRSRLTLPDPFVAQLITDLKPFSKDSGHASVKSAVEMTGRAERVAQVVTEAKPFAAALWAALTAAQRAEREKPGGEAPRGRVAIRRFTIAARWFLVLLTGAEDSTFPLERIMHAAGPQAPNI